MQNEAERFVSDAVYCGLHRIVDNYSEKSKRSSRQSIMLLTNDPDNAGSTATASVLVPSASAHTQATISADETEKGAVDTETSIEVKVADAIEDTECKLTGAADSLKVALTTDVETDKDEVKRKEEEERLRPRLSAVFREIKGFPYTTWTQQEEHRFMAEFPQVKRTLHCLHPDCSFVGMELQNPVWMKEHWRVHHMAPGSKLQLECKGCHADFAHSPYLVDHLVNKCVVMRCDRARAEDIVNDILLAWSREPNRVIVGTTSGSRLYRYFSFQNMGKPRGTEKYGAQTSSVKTLTTDQISATSTYVTTLATDTSAVTSTPMKTSTTDTDSMTSTMSSATTEQVTTATSATTQVASSTIAGTPTSTKTSRFDAKPSSEPTGNTFIGGKKIAQVQSRRQPVVRSVTRTVSAASTSFPVLQQIQSSSFANQSVPGSFPQYQQQNQFMQQQQQQVHQMLSSSMGMAMMMGQPNMMNQPPPPMMNQPTPPMMNQPIGQQIGPPMQVPLFIPGQVPGQLPGQIMPGQMPGHIMPGQTPAQVMPGQIMPGQMMPGQAPGQVMPGQHWSGQGGRAWPGQTSGGQAAIGQTGAEQDIWSQASTAHQHTNDGDEVTLLQNSFTIL